MQVCTGCSAGETNVANYLATLYRLPSLYNDFALVGIERSNAATMINYDMEAIAVALVDYFFHNAAIRRIDWLANIAVNINAGMAVVEVLVYAMRNCRPEQFCARCNA